MLKYVPKQVKEAQKIEREKQKENQMAKKAEREAMRKERMESMPEILN